MMLGSANFQKLDQEQWVIMKKGITNKFDSRTAGKKVLIEDLVTF